MINVGFLLTRGASGQGRERERERERERAHLCRLTRGASMINNKPGLQGERRQAKHAVVIVGKEIVVEIGKRER